MMERVLDLASAFVDFLRASSVSVPALQFIGIILVAFLLGLLLGRLTKRGVQTAVEHSREAEAGRIALDFERLTPLGLLEEEDAENPAMDISDLRPDHMPEGSAPDHRKEQQDPTPSKE